MELRPYEAIGGDAAGLTIERELRADYALAGATFGGVGAWFYRVCYTAQAKGLAGALAQHQREWRTELERAAGAAIAWPTPTVRPKPPLETLARIRGAMWTQRLQLPLGPYPGQPYNINAMDFYECYGPDDRQRMIAKTLEGGYTHAVTGPFYDAGGYHGHYPAATTLDQAHWDAYLDAMEEWRAAGITPIHFVKPDNWTLAQVREHLERFYRQPRALELLPILVPAGWEPVRYEWSSRTWATFFQWAGDLNPDALILAHSVNDTDALKGRDAVYNDEPETNDRAWVYQAPLLHGWLIQLNGYVGIPFNDEHRRDRIAAWQTNLAAYFRDADRRFRHGYAGWPTGSRFGRDVPLKLYLGECASYAFFRNPLISEDEVREFGAIAMANGADGYLDAGSVEVP